MYELSQNIWPLNWLLDKYCQDNNIKFLCLQQYSLYRAARFPNIEGILGFQVTTLFSEKNEHNSWLFKIAKKIAIVFLPTEVGRLCFIVTSEAEEKKEGKEREFGSLKPRAADLFSMFIQRARSQVNDVSVEVNCQK